MFLSTDLRQQRPDALSFINLLPNYASPAQMGAANYSDYVMQFLQVVKPMLLCMDHYPSFPPAQVDIAIDMMLGHGSHC